MAREEVPVKFNCSKCGDIALDVADPVTDDSAVRCKSCGADFGRWADVKAQATKAVADKLRADFRDAFKGFKG